MGPVEDLEQFDRNKSWMAIFQKIRADSFSEHNFSWKDSKKSEFKSRNRYGDVSPYDYSRVKLVQDNIDYINASLVKADDANRAYILTQGPLPETSGHFWLMVWEQNSSAILMLNKIIEKDHVKCHKYYPSGTCGNDLEMTFIDVGLKVKFCDELESNKDFVLRLLELEKLKTPSENGPSLSNHHDDHHNDDEGDVNGDVSIKNDPNKRQILQFHYTSWPDFGVPDTPTDFLNFLFTVRKYKALDCPTRPPVIHCSAGIGRSGTFCLVDTCLVLAEKKGGLDGINVLERLMEMRKYRMGLIQTHDQLRFSFVAIVKGATRLMGSRDHEEEEEREDVDTNGYEEDDEGEEEMEDYDDDDDDDDDDEILEDDDNDDDDDDDCKFQHLNNRHTNNNYKIQQHHQHQQQQHFQFQQQCNQLQQEYYQQQHQQQQQHHSDVGSNVLQQKLHTNNVSVNLQQQAQHPTTASSTNVETTDVNKDGVQNLTTKFDHSLRQRRQLDDDDDDDIVGTNKDNDETNVECDNNNDDDGGGISHENLLNNVCLRKDSSNEQLGSKRKIHEERVKKTQEMVERMKRKQLEADSTNHNSRYLFTALSLAVVVAGVMVYKYMFAAG